MSPSSSFARCDVVIVGSGAAGLYAALCLPQDYQVYIISKTKLSTGASKWAQGGIAAAIAPQDSPVFHLEDTLKAGAGLCETEAVNFLVNHGAAAIDSLLAMGVEFDRKGQTLAMTLEAAHSQPRVLHAADTTGKAIVSTLKAQVLARKNITIISQGLVLDLWLNQARTSCQGIAYFADNQIKWLQAKAVVLATGGGGQIFSHTTNPSVSTGDGIAIAARHGVELRDLEFFQFHPTALMKAGAPHFLISEAVRGEGAHLIDHRGDRFVFNYDTAGELAPRDVVSRAIFFHLAQHPKEDHVFLDLSPIDRDRLTYRFPNIIRMCQQWGIDVLHEPIPVAPAAHYWMGGIKANTDSKTSLPHLYTIGETASTGVHGANRLASNSLLECIVYAQQLASLDLHQVPWPTEPFSFETQQWPDTIDPDQIAVCQDIRQKLPHLMWQQVSISRDRPGLTIAIETIKHWQQQLSHLPLYETIIHPRKTITHFPKEVGPHIRLLSETVNLTDVALLVTKGALFREESRGGHYRLDFPETKEHWADHTLFKGDQLILN
ncbi:MAG: L-aspartate oxidase [Synechococcaceae cyanobacterium RL_1_2]|nr:L-aspartate oxidase [Synechococcaceae cyanobacterium RL_1_2]